MVVPYQDDPLVACHFECTSVLAFRVAKRIADDLVGVLDLLNAEDPSDVLLRSVAGSEFHMTENHPTVMSKCSHRGDGTSAVASKRAWSSIKATASPKHGTTSFAALVDVTEAVCDHP